MKIVRRNDETLVELKKDIPSAVAAEGVILDGLVGDIKTLSEELSDVHQTVVEEADLLDEGDTLHCNKVDPLTGRTPMEIFTLRATSLVNEAVNSIDDLKSSYVKLLEYFGEAESMPSDEFFGTINKFVASFEAAAEQVAETEKKIVSNVW